MLVKLWGLMFVFFLVLGVLLGSSVFERRVAGLEQLIAENVDTGVNYPSIQAAINAPETLAGHTILVGAGVFRGHVTVNKSVSLVGWSPDMTFLEGGGSGIVVRVACNKTEVRGFSIRNGTFGLWVDYSNDSKIVGNRLYGGSYGIRLYHSNNSLVVGNYVSGCRFFGIELDSSGNSTLRNNVMVDNRYNFGVDGRSLHDFVNDIDASNVVNGKAVRYLVNQHGVRLSSVSFDSIGYLGVVNSSNIIVEDLDVQNNIQGVLCAFVTNLSVINVNAHENWNGVYVVFSPNASVVGVKANHNFDYGIKFFWSPGCWAFNNNASNNGWAGIGVFGSSNSVVELNEVSFGTYDLHVVYTNNSVITRNMALVKGGSYSIALYYSHGNLIFGNTFDSRLLFAESRNGTLFTPSNRWDDGAEGNFWRFYGGRDLDLDGVGDVAFNVGENNFDYFPLLGRFSEFSVDFGEKVYNFGLISNSTIADFQFDVDNTRVSFSAVGRNGTGGFCRVGVPAGLLDELAISDLSFSVNGEEPIVVRQWSSGASEYWYLLFVNVVPQAAFDALFLGVVFVLLILVGLALMVLWKLRAR